MGRAVAIAILALCIAAVGFVAWRATSMTARLITIQVGPAALQVEVADTDAKRARGLSGHEPLPEWRGMLFVFETENSWGIWMKDMRFPLDIIWADKDGVISTIDPDVSPESYPKAFYPSAPALYVLEVPAGWAKLRGVAEGMKIVI